MKKLISFLSGIVLIAIAIGMVGAACIIYDTTNSSEIKPYFFQPNTLSQRRVDDPKTVSDLGDETVRNMLIYKYVNEYFYVVPNQKEIDSRIKGYYSPRTPTVLRGMSAKPAFDYWVKNESERIRELSSKGVMRTIDVKNISVGATGHLIVEYELKTWFTANDMYETPTITRGRMYMDVRYTPGTYQDTAALERLERGVDAASVFNFTVLNVEQE